MSLRGYCKVKLTVNGLIRVPSSVDLAMFVSWIWQLMQLLAVLCVCVCVCVCVCACGGERGGGAYEL